ncbi:protein ZAR1-like isoform X1 [Monodelphis domestica]|uniref:protein ZAR1-like isoform X1 n=1 Tax=Monodelphis domestica TaxID=13616 RepID=UPI0024E2490C|nr:protein ZAR1-like isoform X1 [Monodelphis domestica]
MPSLGREGASRAMERFVCFPYSVYQGYGNPLALNRPSHPKQKQPGPPAFLVGPGQVPPNPADYLDSYKRAQLKAILSQVNPNMSLRLCKANTKDIGVQVSPRTDKFIQCSLGPRTLRSSSASEGSINAGLPTRGFYSPVLGRGLLIRLGKQEGQGKEKASFEGFESSPQQPSSPESEGNREAEEQPQLLSEKSLEEGAGLAASPEQETQHGEVEHQEGTTLLKKPTFQFLEQKYGYFHCKDCKTRWESAYVWCISGSNKVYFKQLCRKCQKSFNPYRVEGIQCQTCSKSRCSCPQKKRHIDLKRPHRQELCGRCKDKRLSCDNIYSFKYIV